MEYDHEARMMNFISGLLLGAVIGAGVAMLTAPQSGRRTRKKIRRAATDLRDQATDQWDELAEEMKDKVDDAITGARKKLTR